MKKYTIYLTLALSILAQSFSSNLNASNEEVLQEIEVEYDPKAVTIHVKENDLFLTPIDKSISFCIQTAGQNKIKIMGFPVIYPSTTTTAFDGDITHLEKIIAKDTQFHFKNANFVHMAKDHDYQNCLFNFKNAEAAVTLTGPKTQQDSSNVINNYLSQNLGNMQLNLTAVNPNLLNLFGSLIQNHESNPLETLKPVVPKTCSMTKIKIQSFHFQDYSVNLTGKFTFRENFEIFSYFKNAYLTLTANENFYFLLTEKDYSNNSNCQN